MARSSFVVVAFLAVSTLFLSLFCATRAEAIPAFSREYKTECTTCHTIFPKLSEFGEAYMKNGFVWPGAVPLSKKVKATQTEEERKSAEFIKLSGIPAAIPVSFLTSVSYVYDDTKEDDFDQKRYSAQILTGGAFGGDRMGFWFHESLGSQTTTSTNSLTGPSNVYLVARHPFGLPLYLKAGKFGPDLSLWSTSIFGGMQSMSYSADGFSPGGAQSGLELRSFLGSRVEAVFGMNDRNNSSNSKVTHSVNDLYGRIGVKFGGADYLGKEPEVDLDKDSIWDFLSVQLSVFGYDGTSSVGDGIDHDLSRYGLEAGADYKKLSLMLGVSKGENNSDADDPLSSKAASAEVNYVFNPMYAIGVRYDYVDVEGKDTRTIITPGIAYAPLQNFRLRLTVASDTNPGNSDTDEAEKNTIATLSASMCF